MRHIGRSVLILAALVVAAEQTPARGAEFWEAVSVSRDFVRSPGGQGDLFRGQNPEDSWGTLFLWHGDSTVTGGPDLDEPLVTDRPDFTEATVTVGKGVAQIEMGYTFGQNRDAGVRTRSHSWGEPLLRYGVFEDWFELRLALFPATEQVSMVGGSDSSAGLQDLYTGCKIALTPQDGCLPEMALVPQMNIPIGSDSFSSRHLEPGVNWLYGWEVNDFISTAGSTQGNLRFDGLGDNYLELAQSWTVAYSLTDDIGAYTEWFAIIPTGNAAASTEHYFNGGFTYLLNNDVQFDIRAGVGLNDAADDYFIGTGISIRFPNHR